jgi:hypothetical protein
MANVKISDLGTVTSLNSADLLPCVSGIGSSPTTSAITIANMRTVIGTGNTTIAASSYTATPLANNVITFSDTTGIYAGQIVSLTHDSETKYFMVTSVASNTSVTLSGPDIYVTDDVSNFVILSKQRSVILDIVLGGSFAIGGTTTSLINRETRTKLRWHNAKSYLVYAAARNNTADGTSPGSINVKVARSGSLSTYNDVISTSNAIALTSTNWNAVSPGLIEKSYYDISFADEIEVGLVSAGTDGDARDLTISLVFALEF